MAFRGGSGSVSTAVFIPCLPTCGSSNLARQPLQPEASVIQHGRRKQIPAVRLCGGAEPAGGESFAFPKSSPGEIAPKITL